jgi:hypothetical protein
MKQRSLFLPLLLLCLCCAGCAGLPTARPLPATVATEPVTTTTAPLFAVAPTGQRLAVIRDGLRLVAPKGANDTLLTDTVPVALAWSPDSQRLAAAFTAGGKSTVRIYGSDGGKQGETAIAGNIGAIVWRSPQELLIASSVVTTYTFGTDFQQTLYRWNGTAAPSGVLVHNATLRPSTVRQLGPDIARAFTLALSPLGDAIAFTRLHDPPEFTPYLRIMLRHLDTGTEREVTNIDLNSAPPVFVGLDDELLVNDNRRHLSRHTPWRKELPTPLSVTGSSLAASPGGKLLLVDGQLLIDREPIASFPATVTGIFANQGAELFVLHRGTIHRLTGLPADGVAQPTGERLTKLLSLRALRSQGLISPDDLRTTMTP